jgi:hypothetical protein
MNLQFANRRVADLCVCHHADSQTAIGGGKE